MTKTLTEQWKDLALPDGYYYIRVFPHLLGKEIIVPCYCSDGYCGDYKYNELKEVLAPVPSYEEYKELVSKTDKLEKMAFHYTPEEWNTMLRMVERLQKQLAEANEVIKKYGDGSIYLFPTWYNGSFEAEKYLEKWGVK